MTIEGLFGRASKIDIVAVETEFSPILTKGETVQHAYELIRDYFVFTNKRFVIVNIQGITGKKVEYHSIPYKSITHFSIETAGTLDFDAELKIWISGTPAPIEKKFDNKLNIYEVQSVLASYVLGSDYLAEPSPGTILRSLKKDEMHDVIQLDLDNADLGLHGGKRIDAIYEYKKKKILKCGNEYFIADEKGHQSYSSLLIAKNNVDWEHG